LFRRLRDKLLLRAGETSGTAIHIVVQRSNLPSRRRTKGKSIPRHVPVAAKVS
jgi:hypothetical protein